LQRRGKAVCGRNTKPRKTSTNLPNHSTWQPMRGAEPHLRHRPSGPNPALPVLIPPPSPGTTKLRPAQPCAIPPTAGSLAAHPGRLRLKPELVDMANQVTSTAWWPPGLKKAQVAPGRAGLRPGPDPVSEADPVPWASSAGRTGRTGSTLCSGSSLGKRLCFCCRVRESGMGWGESERGAGAGQVSV
jgi:hypothetical protein